MRTNLSRFFRQRRIEQGLRFPEAARRCVYRNIEKGCNRIQQFENYGDIHDELLKKLATALDISNDDIRRCIAADKAEWEQWADEPVEPYLVVRLMAAIYSPKSIPAELHSDREAMERFASDFARRNHHFRVCLILGRRICVWFDRDGSKEGETKDTFEQSFQPYMRLGRRKFLLNFLDS